MSDQVSATLKTLLNTMQLLSESLENEKQQHIELLKKLNSHVSNSQTEIKNDFFDFHCVWSLDYIGVGGSAVWDPVLWLLWLACFLAWELPHVGLAEKNIKTNQKTHNILSKLGEG